MIRVAAEIAAYAAVVGGVFLLWGLAIALIVAGAGFLTWSGFVGDA